MLTFIARILVIPAILFGVSLAPSQADAAVRAATICPRQAAHPGKMKCFKMNADVKHHHTFNPYFYVTHKNGAKVFVDVVGNAWLSREDAVCSSKRIIRWAYAVYVGPARR